MPVQGRQRAGLGTVRLVAAILLAMAVDAPVQAHDRPLGHLGVDMLVAEAPPLTSQNPLQPGMVLEIVREAAKRGAIDLHLYFMPWRRAQDMASVGENLLIAPIARIPFREGRYYWIAPLHRQDWVLSSPHRKIDSLEQALAERLTIVVGAGSAQERLLIDAGYPEELILAARLGDKEIDLLLAGRADLWLNSLQETNWRWNLAKRPEKLVIGNVIDSHDSYLACSVACDEQIVADLRRAILAMRRDGTLDRIIARYGYGS